MIWIRSHKFDPRARVIADRHYNRQKLGSPQFCPPGKTVVLYAEKDAGRALWVSSFQEFVMHAWPGAWNCSTFRNESCGLSSELIRDAISATIYEWGDPPAEGMITFVNAGKVKRKRDPGRCFVKAGFTPCGRTKVNELHVLRILPEDMPEPKAPMVRQLSLFEARRPA